MAGSNSKVIISAILGNGVITVLKFIAWGFSRSPSLLAEGVHSLADTFNQILLLVGIQQAKKKSTREHPYGPGEASYLWNLISAVGIFFIGFCVTAYHGLHSLIEGHFEVGDVSFLGLGVLVLSLIIEGVVLKQAYFGLKEQMGEMSFSDFLQQTDDPTTLAVFLEDGVAVFGIILALIGMGLGQVFQNAIFDIIASLLISILLGAMAIILGVLNGKLLIGKSLSHSKEIEIETFVLGLSEIEKIISIKTQILGSQSVRLALEVKINESFILIDIEINEALRKIDSCIDGHKTLHKFGHGVLRKVAKDINLIELKIQKQFPEIRIVDLEID